MTTVSGPKESRGTLDVIPGTLVVQNGMLYDYYDIKFGERKGDFIQLSKLPSSITEGFVAYKGKLFKLSIRDFIKGHLNVGQQPIPIVRESDSAKSDEPAPKLLSRVDVDKESVPSGEPGPGLDFSLQEREAADMAWKEQVESLLHADDPQEEWIYQTTAQS